jgi:hypothetical protein
MKHRGIKTTTKAGRQGNRWSGWLDISYDADHYRKKSFMLKKEGTKKQK